MLINEVAYKVGVTRKSIMYYESMGLLNPKRNSKNDYRYYDEEDIKRLRIIKFLRELNIPVIDIKRIILKEIELSDALKDRIAKIDCEIKDIEKIKNMCIDINKNNYNIDNIKIDNYYKEMNILNKKGVTMRDVKTDHNKKILGACISSLVFSALFIFIFSMMTFFQITEEEKIPMFIFIILSIIILFPVVGIVYNLVIRIKEIKGGEEDEASKY